VTSGSFERVGNTFFTVETPPGSGWEIRSNDLSVSMERRESAWLQTIGKTLINVSIHPLPQGPEVRSEQDLAKRFLGSEKERYYGLEPGDAMSTLIDKESDEHGHTLYGIQYSAWWRQLSTDPMWADEISDVKAEVYVSFPEGPSGSKYYRFEIMVTRVAGWATRWEDLRLIDGVIDSVQEKEAPPKERPPVATPGVSP
jgi:hypothetical protein